MKKCSGCKIEKEINKFNRNIKRKCGYGDYCKQCLKDYRQLHKKAIAERKKILYQQNRDEILKKRRISYDPLKNRENHLKQQYGITLIEYQRLFEKQDGKCAICQRRDMQKLCVDHNHDTKEIRGLLCSNCNVAIGLLGDNVDLLRNAITYLETP